MRTLPKTARLKGQRDFEYVLREGIRKRAGQIIFVVGKSGKQRIGVRISRRAGSAVLRNRIKRVIREFFRLNREAFPEGDILVIAQPGLAEKTNSEIRGLMKEVSGKILKCTKK